MSGPSSPRLTRRLIEQGLDDLARLALADGAVVEIAIYGGAAMMLALDARRATKDVDAVLRSKPSAIRRYARAVAKARGWDAQWLNDAVKGYLSPKDDRALTVGPTFPKGARVGLRVFFPAPEYPLAMKCLAIRIDALDKTSDLADIEFLMRRTGIVTADALLDLVAAYYPKRAIPPRTEFGIRQIADEFASSKGR